MSKFIFELPQLQNYSIACQFEKYFNEEELKFFHTIWKTNKSEMAGLAGDKTEDETLRKSQVVFLPPTQTEAIWFFNKMGNLALQVNRERYGFDLHGFYEPLQIASYKEGDFFDWHSDFGIGGTSNRKLSISVQLSDPDEYEGGDLEFMINKEQVKAPREKGTAIIFPSFVLHRVTKITKGERRSVVGWVSGPPFK